MSVALRMHCCMSLAGSVPQARRSGSTAAASRLQVADVASPPQSLPHRSRATQRRRKRRTRNTCCVHAATRCGITGGGRQKGLVGLCSLHCGTCFRPRCCCCPSGCPDLHPSRSALLILAHVLPPCPCRQVKSAAAESALPDFDFERKVGDLFYASLHRLRHGRSLAGTCHGNVCKACMGMYASCVSLTLPLLHARRWAARLRCKSSGGPSCCAWWTLQVGGTWGIC